MTPEQERAMEQMRSEIADKCVEIEDITKRYKVPMCNITVLARDPLKPQMWAMVSSERGEDALRTVANLITQTQPGERTVTPPPIEP